MNEEAKDKEILELHKIVSSIKTWMEGMEENQKANEARTKEEQAIQNARLSAIESRQQEEAIVKAKEREEMSAFMEFVKKQLSKPKELRAQVMEYTKFFVYIALFVLAIWKFSAIEVVQAEQLRAPQTERSVEK